MSLIDRIRQSWNAFQNRDPTSLYSYEYGPASYLRPDRPLFTQGNEKSIITAIYNRISLDVAAIDLRHVQMDDDDRFLYEIESGLNNCLKLEANIDQSARAFIQDVVISMFDEGAVCIFPYETDVNPDYTDSFDILKMRTAKIIEWYPTAVKLRAYNDRNGQTEDIKMEKREVGIVENPLYAVVNERNSTMQRLKRKLALLDRADEHNNSNKLDIIIQLPYMLKTEAKRNYIAQRKKDIEMQLATSKLGIAYADSTEKIVQLNRPVENNLHEQIEYLTNQLYGQLGLTPEIMNGTADEKAMLNYQNRTIVPIVGAIADEMNRKFLTKNARTRKQKIMYFKDPFKLVPVDNIAEIADKFTRNEIMTSNEIRQVIGMKPSNDPNADILRNKNLSYNNDELLPTEPTDFREEEY